MLNNFQPWRETSSRLFCNANSKIFHHSLTVRIALYDSFCLNIQHLSTFCPLKLSILPPANKFPVSVSIAIHWSWKLERSIKFYSSMRKGLSILMCPLSVWTKLYGSDFSFPQGWFEGQKPWCWIQSADQLPKALQVLSTLSIGILQGPVHHYRQLWPSSNNQWLHTIQSHCCNHSI